MKNKREKTKTEVISHKVTHVVKNALLSASKIENRSQANMLEVMIIEYCKNHNIKIDL